MPAPVIETERLRLRPQRLEDFEPLAALYASGRSAFIGGPLPRAKVWYGFAADTGCWDLRGYGAWSVEEKDTGALVGQVGLNHPPHFAEREIGWILHDGYEGRGYAFEAASAARAYAYGTAGWTTAVSYIDPANTRSIALAERLGARPDPEAPRHHPDDIVYRHPAPEALQ